MRAREVVATQLTGVDLWRSLAAELKLPLTQIARTAELVQSGQSPEGLRSIEAAASSGLRLIDSFLLLSDQQRQLPLTPVSVSALLYSVAEEMSDLSRLYDAKIDIRLGSSTPQIMAHGAGLEAALTALVYTFLTGGLRSRKQTVTLIAKRSGGSVVTGVVCSSANITAEDLQLARRLFGRAAGPANHITQNSGVGLYMADNLLTAMEAPLKVIRNGRQTGLAATLLPSQQLVLL